MDSELVLEKRDRENGQKAKRNPSRLSGALEMLTPDGSSGFAGVCVCRN